ncbi:multisubunit potassium/proton antiporter PhaE subunit [Rhodovulum bhavnagarense]|uniref:Multisubunit potassium/proton antiporter PhaE subunit n=1 Tax=Rhodovulum bhavnagarense TaxID=992286 RepID=A0A4R2RGS5_9RHOB|nr:Na+/H+ antiporter subunit E [Rhodovulum bhavnagarense]TCP62880.1 multisubunit potassium/proton antiporter PhaE subunit [Rhodovulum bhavnagarense]
MLNRLFPHPLMSVTLTLVWLGLVNTITPGNLLLGVILGIVLPLVTSVYWPNRPRLRRPLMVVEYGLIVLWDIVVANVQVAKIIAFKRNEKIHSHWINIPLDLTSPEAITVLAGTITMTPGTVSTMLASDGRAILVHCLHTDDPEGVRDDIKARYERRLKEIFQ